MSRNGLLIDYEYCCGCHTCEVACQKEHDYPVEVWGMYLNQMGPYRYEERISRKALERKRHRIGAFSFCIVVWEANQSAPNSSSVAMRIT